MVGTKKRCNNHIWQVYLSCRLLRFTAPIGDVRYTRHDSLFNRISGRARPASWSIATRNALSYPSNIKIFDAALNWQAVNPFTLLKDAYVEHVHTQFTWREQPFSVQKPHWFKIRYNDYKSLSKWESNEQEYKTGKIIKEAAWCLHPRTVMVILMYPYGSTEICAPGDLQLISVRKNPVLYASTPWYLII